MATFKNKKLTNEYKLIIGYIGIFLMLIGFVLVTPFFSLIFFPKDYIYIPHFIMPASISTSLGYILYSTFLKKKIGVLKKHQDIVLVILVWVIAIFIGTIPFLMLKMPFTKSLFEITSGFTTTGFEAFDLDRLPKIFIFYRSITNFFGGIGLVLILASTINMKHGMLFYKAEGHEGLMPSLIKSSKLLFSIYSFFILIGTCMYVIAGMDLFDAINHSISSIATGGFSTVNKSLADHKFSQSAEIVSIILMIFGSTNFLIYVAIYKMKFKSIFKNSETIYSLFLYFLLMPIVVLFIAYKYSRSFSYSSRYYSFLYISAQTTTGLSNLESILRIPDFLFIILLGRMIVGGQSGSTSSGIKQYRMAYIFKGMSIYLLNLFKNDRTISTSYIYVMGQKRVFSKDEYRKHLSFAFLYLLIVVIGGLLVLATRSNSGEFVDDGTGILIKQGIFNFAAALGNVGLSMTDITKVGNAELWVYMFAMFLGRLEILPVFIGAKRMFYDIFKKKKRKIVYS